ncbi:MAG: PAS domain-containing sensor histidine kinase [Gemmatimonadota bacterium]
MADSNSPNDQCEEGRFEALARNAAEPIITIDDQDRIVFANPAAERVFGFSVKELLQLEFTALIPERYRARHRAGLERYMKTGEQRLDWGGVQLPGLHRAGHEIPLEITFSDYRQDGRRYFTGIMRDISERMQVDQERARLLEREQLARAEAEAANRAKSAFLATMSHEIRTPINAVMGYADLLDAQIEGPLNTSQRAYVRRIQASSHHLLSLISDVLDLAKVEAGHMTVEHERCLVVVAVSSALSVTAPLARERGLRIRDHCSGDAAISYVGDEDRVRQVLINLLSNAVKFTNPGGSIEIRCDTADEPGFPPVGSPPESWTYITVTDTGVGIKQEDLASIFLPFVQSESGLTRRKGGTGLGLTISRELACLMGGDLTVESTVGKGSSFTLWLPGTIPESIAPEQTWISKLRAEGHRPRGFAVVGEQMIDAIDDILDEYADRLKQELPLPRTSRLEYADLVNHAGTFLTDIAQALIVLENSNADPVQLMHDGTQIQRVISELHGAQRFRLGWTEEMLAGDWRILWEAISRWLDKSRVDLDHVNREDALSTLKSMVDFAEATSLRGLRTAALQDIA